MASWLEIDRIRKNPKGFRALAKSLHTHISGLTDWEVDFLASIAAEKDRAEFTTRQSEKLLQIRDDHESVTEIRGGFGVKTVLQQCYEARLDLREDDEEWIARRYENSPTTIRRKYAGRLRRCACELGLIDADEFDNVAA
jgi:hypothetical protein